MFREVTFVKRVLMVYMISRKLNCSIDVKFGTHILNNINATYTFLDTINDFFRKKCLKLNFYDKNKIFAFNLL